VKPSPRKISELLRRRHQNEKALLATVSGIASTSISMIDWFARNTKVDIITTKSIEVHANPGNREPVIAEPEPGSYGNAVGLRNPGLDTALEQLEQLRARWNTYPLETKPLINVSLSASSASDFALLARRLEVVADLLELNLSCPHAKLGFGAAIGSDPAAIREVISAVVATTDLPVFVKLTPNVKSIGAMAKAAMDAGADGIAAINSVGPRIYLEPHSGEPILSSPSSDSKDSNSGEQGRGGMSGRWVHSIALAAISEIRRTVGPDMPIIGMGGVDSRKAFVSMHEAGADAVGIGSALGGLHQRDWPSFLQVVSGKNGNASLEFRFHNRIRMKYKPYRVVSNRHRSDDIVEIELDRALTTRPGQAVFAWLPNKGEKPLAPALSDPLTFIVKKKGEFSRAFVTLQPGAVLYIRGPYGNCRKPPETSSARAGESPIIMVVAGTGFAAVSIMALELLASGRSVFILVGMRDVYSPFLSNHAELMKITHIVEDDGREGRVIDVFEKHLSNLDVSDTTVISAGPEPFMRKIVSIAGAAGIKHGDILLSLERTMLCGVGLCGACDCSGRLTCQYGTFISAREFASEWQLSRD